MAVKLLGKMKAVELDNGSAPNRDVMVFTGGENDTKPLTSWEGSLIAQGSVFIDFDTNESYMYDEENVVWKTM